ncbi:hypothetical protein BOP99_06765 [Campylobacter coli]|nr:hypothetical protein BOP99_06765 [Campylobacter coli]
MSETYKIYTPNGLALDVEKDTNKILFKENIKPTGNYTEEYSKALFEAHDIKRNSPYKDYKPIYLDPNFYTGQASTLLEFKEWQSIYLKDPIKGAQNITNICINYVKKGFKEVLIEQLGIIYLLTHPQIEVEVKKYGKKYFKTINKEIAAKRFSTIKEELFFNKTKISFMAEQVKNGIDYEIDQKLEENKEFLLKRLLSYLIIDEKRSATALEDIKEQKYIIDDYTFYFKELKSLELKKCTIYQLSCNHPLFKEFRNKEKQISAFKKDEDSPIHAYNEALQILQDFANGIYNTSKDKTGKCIEDKNKTRRLLEKLNIIGQNNLKAMYMGINGNKDKTSNTSRSKEDMASKIDANADIVSETKAPPNFIGRLATTIIIEDGLYMG